MNLDSIRLRLTVGYVGIFSLLLLLVGVFAVFGFWRELDLQQDEPRYSRPDDRYPSGNSLLLP